MKKIILMAVAATMIFACSKGGGETPLIPDADVAYLSLTFPTMKASSTDAGTPVESKITKATVLVFDEANKCLGVVDYGALTSGTKSAAKEVPSKTKKVFVVINSSAKWDLESATVVGKSWLDINTDATIVVGDITTDDNFMMTNSGDLVKGGLADVTVYPTAPEAENAPTAINVDRLASKVSVTSTAPTSPNGTFTFSGWELNTVNKFARLYAERVTYAKATGVYRIDKNYFKKDFLTDQNHAAQKAYLEANYTWLKNGTSTADMSPIAKTSGASAYCTENTMDASGQLWGHTTKVVIKGVYTPTGLTASASYFSWNSKYYSVATIKTEYKKPEYGTVAAPSGLRKDLMDFLTSAGATDLADETKIDAAIDVLDDYSGIKAAHDLAVRYYHNSVCYYDALIRHDDAIDATMVMALGRYGVVRNNSYQITVASVNGPGTPWIPDPTDPKDPSKPTDPDDESPAYLSIQVTVNPWTVWSHGVDLGN